MSKTRLLVVVLLVAALGLVGCDSGSRSDAGEAPAKPAATPAADDPAAASESDPRSKLSIAPVRERKETPDPTLPHNRALLDALAEPDPFERVVRLGKLLPTLGPEAVPQAKASLAFDIEDQLSKLGVAEYVLLLRYWALHDSEAAARYAFYQSPFGYRTAVTLPIVEEWAREEPLAVAEALGSSANMPGFPLDIALVALVRGWFQSGEPGLDDFIARLPEGVPRQRALSIYARMLIRRDGTEAAQRWVADLPEDDLAYKLAAYRQMGIALAKEAPLFAISWCDEYCDGPYGEGVRPLVAQHYAERDGRAAMEWLSRVPPGVERDRSVTRAFSGWWQEDSEGLRRWVDEIAADGEVPDFFQPGLELYAAALARREGETAVRWAQKIEDEQMRQRSLMNVARQWRSVDPEAAEAWLESSPLTEAQRERVRNPQSVQVTPPRAPTAQR